MNNHSLTNLREPPLPTGRILFLASLHVILGLAMSKASMVASIHAYLTFLIAVWVSVMSPRSLKTACLAAYIAGGEVLWRMTHANIIWEFGKYSIALVFLIRLFRSGTRKPLLPILYILFLLPSVYFPLENKFQSDIHHIHKQISFNLSGPIALAISVLFFSKQKLTKNELHLVFLSFVIPVLAAASITAFVTYTSDIQFGTESNVAASGGFGPNQVSSVLGLGALFVFFFLLDSSGKMILKMTMILVGILLVVQSALTFSRGGLYAAVISFVLASFYLIRNAKMRNQFLFFAILFSLVGNFVIFPRLDKFTNGAIKERFKETDLTGREDIMESEMLIWKEHLVLGVGPGQAAFYRDDKRPAHTEFTRLLAEHGILGIFALLCLIFIVIINFFSARTPRTKALLISTASWALLYMGSNGMRIAAPSFVFGLASAVLLDKPRIVNAGSKSQLTGK